MKLTIPVLTCIGFFMAGCGSSQNQEKNFPEKRLVIANKETVKVKELDLSITNNGCGRKWVSEGNNPSYERAYCDLVIKYKDSVIHAGGNFKPFNAGAIQIEIDKMNPWGVTEDSVPPGACRIWLRRNPAFALLEKYGWSPEKIINEAAIAFPDTIRGIPWVQYESAAGTIGFHLTALAGQTLAVLKIQLKEKGKRSGTNLWAHIIMDDGEPITGWLSSQLLVPGLAPLNLSKDKLGNW